MNPCVRVKDGVEFAVIAPAGFRILAALEHVAQHINHDLTITSGTDGVHSGPNDPHYRGEAYDVRTSDLPDKATALARIMEFLGEETFFGFIEEYLAAGEHIHIQLRQGMHYPV